MYKYCLQFYLGSAFMFTSVNSTHGIVVINRDFRLIAITIKFEDRPEEGIQKRSAISWPFLYTPSEELLKP